MVMEQILRDPRCIYRWYDVLCLARGATQCRPSFIPPNGSLDIWLWMGLSYQPSFMIAMRSSSVKSSRVSWWILRIISRS